MESEILPFEVTNNVRTIRGHGQTGRKIHIISWAEVLGHAEATCPECGYDRVKKVEDVNPEVPNEVFRECHNCNLNVERWLERREREEERNRRDEGRGVPMRERDARRDSLRDRHVL